MAQNHIRLARGRPRRHAMSRATEHCIIYYIWILPPNVAYNGYARVTLRDKSRDAGKLGNMVRSQFLIPRRDNRPGSPRHGAQPICAVRPLHGRLHRFRDGAPRSLS
jgi:hypothetical protein